MDNMISGAILAVLILLIFMKDTGPTLVIACSIPISVVAAVVLMYFQRCYPECDLAVRLACWGLGCWWITLLW